MSRDLLDDFSLLLVDDHPLFRDGLVAALRHHAPGLHVHAVGTFDQALDALKTADGQFDLMLLDYVMPGTDGLRCARQLMRTYADVGVGLISGLADPGLPGRARDAGLSAYLSKSLEISVLLEHLRRLAQGQPVFTTVGLTHGADPGPSAFGLTSRQLEVLQALARGCSNKEIAQTLGIAPGTVKKHLEAVYSCLNATNRLQAVMKAQALLNELRS